MRKKLQMPNCECRQNAPAPGGVPVGIWHSHSTFATRFTLVEVLVVMTLLSLIVLVLMAVFNSTQTAFRASVTQADVLECGRAAMDLMAAICGRCRRRWARATGAVNFYAVVPSGYTPLVQPLLASSPPQSRTNVQENLFILSRQNQTWTGVGYVVANSPQGDLDSLYRFTMTTNVQAAGNPAAMLFNIFRTTPVAGMSHLMDGVVNLTVRAYDVNGGWMTNHLVVSGGRVITNKNVYYLPAALGQTGFYMFSNTLPAAVEIEMGVLEDRALQRAESLSVSPPAQTNYLAQQAGAVHIFRQRVSIPNVDPSAYQ